MKLIAKLVSSNTSTGAGTITITDTKIYVPVVTLSFKENTKLLHQLKSKFKRTTNWNKYRSKILTQPRNHYLDDLIYPSFHGANRLFVSSFKILQTGQQSKHRILFFKIKNKRLKYYD